MARTMRAAVVRGFGRPLRIEEVPIPTPGPGEVLVKIMASGVCHTDLHAADGDWPVKPGLPFIPGHEGAGIVAALGAGVTRAEGRRPGRRRLAARCVRRVRVLHHRLGDALRSAAQQRLQRQRQLRRIRHRRGAPTSAGCRERPDFAALAPILCAGVTTYKGIKETEARPGEWLAISGVGGLGHVAVQYAKAMGLHVVAVDVTEEKLALARTLGADIAVNARAPGRRRGHREADRRRRARRARHRRLGRRRSPRRCSMVRRKGTVSLVGLPPGEFPTPIFDVVLKRITIRGSIVGTRQDLAEAIAFAAEGKVSAHIHTRGSRTSTTCSTALKAGSVDGRMVLDIGVAAPLAATSRVAVTV